MDGEKWNNEEVRYCSTSPRPTNSSSLSANDLPCKEQTKRTPRSAPFLYVSTSFHWQVPQELKYNPSVPQRACRAQGDVHNRPTNQNIIIRIICTMSGNIIIIDPSPITIISFAARKFSQYQGG